jgi:hypothetical protein
MRPKALFVVLVTLALVSGISGAAAAPTEHVFSDPQPLPATFRVLLPDVGQQQYAVFEVSAQAPKKFFKKLKVAVEFNTEAYAGPIRYAAGFTKPKTTGGVTTVTVLLPINNVGEGEPIGTPPGSICTDQNQQTIECPPGTINVTISSGSSVKGASLVGTLDGAARFIIDDVTFEEIIGFHAVRYIDYGFPTPAKKIDGFVKSDAKKNGVDSFKAAAPEPPL